MGIASIKTKLKQLEQGRKTVVKPPCTEEEMKEVHARIIQAIKEAGPPEPVTEEEMFSRMQSLKNYIQERAEQKKEKPNPEKRRTDRLKRW